jgi:hypothetical protein
LVEIRAQRIFSPIGKKLKKLKNPIQKDTKKKKRRFILEAFYYGDPGIALFFFK